MKQRSSSPGWTEPQAAEKIPALIECNRPRLIGPAREHWVKTDLTTPQGIFGMPQHLTVPIYQRPYVWTQEDQWAPLWGDIRRLTEHRMDNESA